MSAAAISLGKARFAVAEQVAAGSGPQAGEEAVFSCRMGLERAVAQDMADGKTALRQRAAHQQAAVAVERLALGTHQADAVVRHLAHDPIDTGVKIGRPPSAAPRCTYAIPASASPVGSARCENQG